MTENKRFILNNKTTDSNVYDSVDNQYYSWETVISLLNASIPKDADIDELLDIKIENNKTKYEKRFTFDEDVNKDYLYELGVFSDNEELMETTDVLNCLNNLHEENEQLKQQLFETSKELLWVTSDEVDRGLYYEDEVEELRKEIFE